ncbi:hypothetical protein THER_0561 [Thermodesulfovibrio sp. N1]|nr:hypothetical protein THER_0561 [Thermodesulfovibrio sp. N1]
MKDINIPQAISIKSSGKKGTPNPPRISRKNKPGYENLAINE